MGKTSNHLPPVVLLGGAANSLSVARSLGRAGIKVYAITDPASHVRYSRYCRWIGLPVEGSVEESRARYLLGPESEHLRGAVLLAGSDAGLEIIATNRDELSQKFILDDSNPAAQICMLNKLNTYQSAVASGVPTPKFWVADTPDQIQAIRPELVFPLIVKPLASHVFEKRFRKKFQIAQNLDEVLAASKMAGDAGIHTMLVELIPGPDDRLSSYYTYMDGAGNPLFDFTKRVIRRFPTSMGGGCYHITDRVPELRGLALKLLRHVGLRGLANVEFKHDYRDGQLKLIECNARFTAANCLVAESGYDLALLVYNRLVGRPQPALSEYQLSRRLWYPVEDFKAFLELRANKQITLRQWLGSIMHDQSLPHFRWYDPLPSLVCESRRAIRVLRSWLRGARVPAVQTSQTSAATSGKTAAVSLGEA